MKTALFERHRSLGAKIVNFAGWEMPIQYEGILEEHHTVRKGVGIFDVSHMGRIDVKGNDSEKLLDFLSTNTISKKSDGSATYTVWCQEDGGSVDDLLVYKQDSTHFFVIVNAANRESDLKHLRAVASSFDVTVEERYHDGILAIQGPKGKDVVSKRLKEAENLPYMRFVPLDYRGDTIILSATGYTGSGGVEIYGPTKAIVSLWDELLELGKEEGIKPIGLGARDTLRLEMGYALYGHELSPDIAPSESVSAWTIRWNKNDFVGKSALNRREMLPKKRSQYGIVLQDRGIARQGYSVFQGDICIGKVTSGTMSPSLNRAIAIIMVERKLREGENVFVEIRERKVVGKVVPLPFLSINLK